MRLEHFQMLDRIEQLNAEVPSLTASGTVPETSPVLDGHFPGFPLMPGVLLLETMAQAAGYLLLALDGFSRMPFFASARAVSFRAFVKPGARLTVHAACIHDGSGYAVVDARVVELGKTVSDARLTMRSMPFPNAALEQHVRREGARLGLLEASA
jgi:3-hydroxyacyl-[acyl-carrier-protein] dehydratase